MKFYQKRETRHFLGNYYDSKFIENDRKVKYALLFTLNRNNQNFERTAESLKILEKILGKSHFNFYHENITYFHIRTRS